MTLREVEVLLEEFPFFQRLSMPSLFIADTLADVGLVTNQQLRSVGFFPRDPVGIVFIRGVTIERVVDKSSYVPKCPQSDYAFVLSDASTTMRMRAAKPDLERLFASRIGSSKSIHPLGVDVLYSRFRDRFYLNKIHDTLRFEKGRSSQEIIFADFAHSFY